MRRALVPVSVVALVLLSLLAFGRPGTTTQDATPAATAGEGFVGAWRFNDVSFDLPSLGTFTSDGNFIVSNLPVEPAPPEMDVQMLLLSNGHGVWEATGEDTAAFTFTYLYVDERGTYQSATTLSGMLELGADGQTLTGEYVFDVRQPDGTVVHADRGMVEGTRIGIIPMEELAPQVAGTPAP